MMPARRSRGFALLIVLWTLVLLSLLVTQLTATGRSEVLLAANLRSAATAEAAADGAIEAAVFHLIDNSAAHWPADGAPHALRLDGARVALRIDSEAGRINPNTAQPELLAALLHVVGTPTQSANGIAEAIAAWRFPDQQGGDKAAPYFAAGRDYAPPGAQFESLDEIGLVIGMTPDLLARVTPYLTLYREGDPEPAIAAAPVRAALKEASGTDPVSSGPPDETVVTITAVAQAATGSRFVRRATLHLGTRRQNGGSLYDVLAWTRIEG